MKKYIILSLALFLSLLGCRKKEDVSLEVTEQVEITEEGPEKIGEDFLKALKSFDPVSLDELSTANLDFSVVQGLGDQEVYLASKVLGEISPRLIESKVDNDTASLIYKVESLDLEEVKDKAIKANIKNLLTQGNSVQLEFDTIDYGSIKTTEYDLRLELKKDSDEGWLVDKIDSQDLGMVFDLLGGKAS